MSDHYFGLYFAVVVDVVDPAELGRIRLHFPWLREGAESDTWATLSSPYAEDGQGLLALPSVGSTVVVGFEAGDVRRPIIVGACWGDRAAMPVAPTHSNDKRVLKSSSGAVLEFDDTEGAETVALRLEGHRILINATEREVEIVHEIGSKITINARGDISIQATSRVDIVAPSVDVNAAIADFNGLIKCTTLLASSAVISPSYS